VLSAVTVDGQSKDERWSLVSRRLGAIGGVLAKHDVSLSLEFLGPLVFRRARTRHLPGEGVIDLRGFFQALQAIGYQGGVAPETIGPRIPDGIPPEESARLALEATTATLKKAGVA
jgi:hypothetical protein